MYLAIIIPVLFAFVSLAVDFGRVQLVRRQLSDATDAAALAAAANMNTVAEAQAAATALAAFNSADGGTVALVMSNPNDIDNDVQFVNWNGSSYTLLAGSARNSANAVRVIARRTAARGNPVSLIFASVIGRPTMDVYAASIAMPTLTAYAVVGLNYVNMSGNTTASYSAAKGTSVSARFGNVASNGNITLTGNSFINGNARPGIGMSVNDPSSVSGNAAPLTTTLSFPDLPSGAPTNFDTVNDNADLNAYSGVRTGPIGSPRVSFSSSGNYSLPGGTYYTDDFNISSTANVSFSSPTYLFCFGNFTMSGKTVTASSLPKNLTLVMVYRNSTPPGSVTIGSASAFQGTVYAPYSAVYLTGSGDIYGSVLGKTIDMTGTSRIIYDKSLLGTGEGVKLVH